MGVIMQYKRVTMIFCIGRNRTGTSSLAKALDILGFPCFHDASKANHIIMLDKDMCIKPLSKKKYGYVDITGYKAFADHPFDWIFPELDRAYPGSKFIYTERDIEDYIDSKERLFKTAFRGDYRVDRDALRQDYIEHRNLVENYFKDRELLRLRICDGEDWDSLCEFLGVKKPDREFPHIK